MDAQVRDDTTNNPGPSRVYISTISGGPTVAGNSNRAIKSYARSYRRDPPEIMAMDVMEVYVHDMLVKSLRSDHHVTDLSVTFAILRSYGMRLNPAKCVFGVGSGKFLGFLVSHRGIEANPEKIQALVGMTQPRTRKEV
ncbi:unnamed protein product, partial [Prunus brigantina]